jgi:hypothetical protein
MTVYSREGRAQRRRASREVLLRAKILYILIAVGFVFWLIIFYGHDQDTDQRAPIETPAPSATNHNLAEGAF